MSRGRITKLAYNGWTTGANTKIRELKGFFDMPDLRTADVDLSGMDGVLFGTDEMGKKVIEATFVSYGDGLSGSAGDHDQISDEIDDLVSTFQVQADDTLPLDATFKNALEEETVLTVFCRPRKRPIPLSPKDGGFSIETVVTLEAEDPRIYGPLMTQTVGMAGGAEVGRTYPRVYPWTYGEGGAGGTIDAHNSGSAKSYPVAYIHGPCDTPRLTHQELNRFVKVNLTLVAGDTLVIDFFHRTITIQGMSRYYALTNDSDWFWLDPGSNSIQFLGSYYDPLATVTIAWRSAD